jgi:hypothetical protein
MLDENIPGTSSKNLMKSYFNEGDKRRQRKRRKQRVKNVQELVVKLQTNKVTCQYFNLKEIEDIFYQIYREYYPKRKFKVRNFVEQFRGLTLCNVFEKCLSLLANSMTKLFFNHQDFRAGYQLIREMMEEQDDDFF